MVLEVEGAKAMGIKTLHDTILDSLKARFEKADKTKCLVLATLLHPRYRGHALAPCTLSNAKDWTKDEHATLSEAKKRKRASSEGQGPKRIWREEEEEEDASPSDRLEQMYANLLGAQEPTSEETDDEEEELFTQQLDQYLREPLINRRANHVHGGNKMHPACTFWHHSPENFSVHLPSLCPVRGCSARSARYMRKRGIG